MQQSTSEPNSSLEYDDDDDDLEFDDSCRELTPIDVDQALYSLKMNQNSPRKRTISSDNNNTSTVSSKQECDCCRLLLRTNPSSRLLLPLARRGRPHISTRSHRLLCPNCTEIKRQQQIDILQNQQKFKSDQIFQTIINFDISSEEQLALNNHQYQSTEMLVWKINTSGENTIDLSYNTDSLTENEKKILLEETIKKLQIVLNNRPTTMIDNYHQDKIEFTYRTLQTTINILSSSHNSI